MNTKLITLVVTLVVGVILAGSLLVPVLNDVTTTEKTFTNTGLYRMTEYDTTATLSISWDHTDPYAITINDDKIALPTTQLAIDCTLIGCDEFLIRYNGGTNAYIQYYAADYTGTIVANVSSEKDMVISIASGSATITNGTNTDDVSYSGTIYVCSKDGNLVMSPYTDTAYVLGDSDIYATGRSYVLSTNFTTILSGTIDDGMTTEYWPEAAVSTWTFSDITTNAEEVNGYKDLYKLTSFTWTANDGDDTATITYSQVILPAEVTAELSQHLSSGQNALLNAIPILVIVALVLAAVGMIYVSSND